MASSHRRIGCLTWISSIGSRRIVQDEDAGQVRTDGGEILGVRSVVEGAVLPVVPPVQHPLVAVQLVRHGLPVDLHAGREDHQLEPLSDLKNDRVLLNIITVKVGTYHGQEEIHVRPLVYEKSDRMFVNGDF